jgi:2-polyprenyl-3-methyl-5-hydroxy-6-metoxy-1,4-benzoquinol methylase
MLVALGEGLKSLVGLTVLVAGCGFGLLKLWFWLAARGRVVAGDVESS